MLVVEDPLFLLLQLLVPPERTGGWLILSVSKLFLRAFPRLLTDSLLATPLSWK